MCFWAAVDMIDRWYDMDSGRETADKESRGKHLFEANIRILPVHSARTFIIAYVSIVNTHPRFHSITFINYNSLNEYHIYRTFYSVIHRISRMKRI